MPIETHFDIPFISSLALRKKQIQQNYRSKCPIKFKVHNA